MTTAHVICVPFRTFSGVTYRENVTYQDNFIGSTYYLNGLQASNAASRTRTSVYISESMPVK